MTTETVEPPMADDAPAAPAWLTEGIHNITSAAYHRDPVEGGSLSSSGARKLLAPSCPALFDHYRRNGQPHRKTFDFGHAAHRVVLGAGEELRLIDHPNYLTKAAKADRDAAYADGATPLLPAEMEQVQAMAAAIRQHPVAARLFDPEAGKPEQTMIWRDDRTGIMRRSLVDWLPNPVAGRRLIIADYKTTVAADTESISKAIGNYGYHQQADWYTDGARTLGLAPDGVAFVFVFQEKTAPYLINVVQLDAMWMRIARDKNREAIDLYRECTESGIWPGYGNAVTPISPPPWLENAYLKGLS